MLALARKIGERIVIGGNVEVEVVNIRGLNGGKLMVVLGVVAPREITVDRKEVHEAKRRQAKRDADRNKEPGK